MPDIAVLVTCHNRKAQTLACLQDLHAQQGLGERFRLPIYLVDDGCTDATAESVCQAFSAVKVIKGNGQLFWNGGMCLAWQEALRERHDAYLWVNDDTRIYPDAVYRLLDAWMRLEDSGHRVGALAGSIVDPDTKAFAYGGFRSKNRFDERAVLPVLPSAQEQPCDFVNGNLTLIPQSSVDAIGTLNPVYRHGMGDFDYSCRLRKAGLGCWVAAGVYGEGKENHYGKEEAGTTLREQLEHRRKIERLYPYEDQWYFARHCSGRFWPVWCLTVWLKHWFPWLPVLVASLRQR